MKRKSRSMSGFFYAFKVHERNYRAGLKQKKIPVQRPGLGYKQKHMKQMRLTIKNINPVKPYST